MSNTNTVKTYYPLRFVSSRNTSNPKEQLTQQPLQTKTDYQNRTQNSTLIPKRSTTPLTNDHTETRNPSLTRHQAPKPRTYHEDYLMILQNMERRIQELMREAAGVMELLLQPQNSLQINEKIQQRLRLIDDKDIEKQYRILKEKVATLRRKFITQGSQVRKSTPYYAQVNPQSISDKQRRLQIWRTVDSKCDLQSHHHHPRHSSKKLDPMHSSQPIPHSRQKPIRQATNNGQPLNFSPQMDHLSKRAQHYKQKSVKLQATLESMVKQKEETDRINQEMSTQIIQLRSETLNYKYQYQRAY